MPTPDNPKALDSGADEVDNYIYKEYVKTYAKENRAITRSANKIYSLVLGQYTEILHAKMKGRDKKKNMDNESDPVERLKMIREIAFKVETGKNMYMMRWKIKRETTNLFQKNYTPERYVDKLFSNAQVANQHRCELPGNYPVFTVVMVIYTFVRRISIITLPPNFLKRFYIHIH